MTDRYILRGRIPIQEPDLIRWAKWMGENKALKRVARTTTEKADISTVFLGLDHQWGIGPPLLFETMVFSDDPEIDQSIIRYSTYEEAEKGHQAACIDIFGWKVALENTVLSERRQMFS